MLREIDKNDIGRYAIKDIMVANDRYGSFVSLESMIGEDHIHLMVDEEAAVLRTTVTRDVLYYDTEPKTCSRMPEVSTVLLGSDAGSKPPTGTPEEYDYEADTAEDLEDAQE